MTLLRNRLFFRDEILMRAKWRVTTPIAVVIALASPLLIAFEVVLLLMLALLITLMPKLRFRISSYFLGVVIGIMPYAILAIAMILA